MEELLEFNVVAYLKNKKHNQELEKLKEMGVPVPEEEEKEEKLVKYSFNPKTIIEYRQSFVEYMGEWRDATVVSFTDHVYETPPLLIHYDMFKQKLKEWNETNKKTNEA